ncbi:hypothetical protein M514_06279, partial [Trichuris suis]
MLVKVRKQVQALEHDVRIYCRRLELLHENFLKRFHDVATLAIPDRVLDSFIVSHLNVGIYLQEELIDLQSNDEIKPRMERGYEYFWLCQEIPPCHPTLWAAMKGLLTTILSSSVVECGFSLATDLVTKKRNRLEAVNRGFMIVGHVNAAQY